MRRKRSCVTWLACILTLQCSFLAWGQEESQGLSPTDETLAEGIAAFNRGDVIAAMGHYRDAAAAGSVEAKVRLAWILDQSEDNVGAASLYLEAANEGSAEAQLGLAELYAQGEGVEQDYGRAVALFEASAAGGQIRAMGILATAYESGELGLEKNNAQALAWLKRGAEAGDKASMRRLAEVYRTGALGVEPDAKEAGQWEAKMAENR